MKPKVVLGSIPTLSDAATRAALDTLAGALSAAQTLPAPIAGELVAAARNAFTPALQLAAAASALVAVGLAAMVVRWLASVDPGSSQPDLTPAK